MAQETFIIGSSEDCEAEYSFRADAPFTPLSEFGGEIYCVEGFNSLEAAKVNLRDEGVPASQIIYL